MMGIGVAARVVGDHGKQIFRKRVGRGVHNNNQTSANRGVKVPKGHLAVYVGECYNYKHRFVVPIWYLKHPLFQDLLKRAEEEHGYDHPMGGLTIPCTKTTFLNITSYLNISSQIIHM